MELSTAALHPALNAVVLVFGLMCVLGLFLALTQLIERYLEEENDRSGS